MDATVFIDTEFSPATTQWLSLGAVLNGEMFYAVTGDPMVIAAARAEFLEMNVEPDVEAAVPDQLHRLAALPGVVDDQAQMARAFAYWLQRVSPGCAVNPCYDYSADMQLLEQGMERTHMAWPAHWHPCNLAILNTEAAAEAAKQATWVMCDKKLGIRPHHALADSAALQAAYEAQMRGAVV